MPARTADVWDAPSRPPCMPTKSTNCTAPVSASLKSPDDSASVVPRYAASLQLSPSRNSPSFCITQRCRKLTIEREFQDAEGAKAIGSSHGYFGFIVQPLDHTAGKLLLGLEIVEQQLAVSAQGAGDFLHGLDAGAHGLIAPEIQEVAGPGG